MIVINKKNENKIIEVPPKLLKLALRSPITNRVITWANLEFWLDGFLAVVVVSVLHEVVQVYWTGGTLAVLGGHRGVVGGCEGAGLGERLGEG